MKKILISLLLLTTAFVHAQELGFGGGSGVTGPTGPTGVAGSTGVTGPTGAGATPAGSDTWVQYNNAGVFGADVGFTRVANGSTVISSVLAAGDTFRLDYNNNLLGIPGAKGLLLTHNTNDGLTGVVSGNFSALGASRNRAQFGFLSRDFQRSAYLSCDYDSATAVAKTEIIAAANGVGTQLRIRSDGAINFKGQTPTYEYNFPRTTPTLGQIMVADGSGNLAFQTATSTDWGILGNSGTNSTTNFIGTTDAQDLVFRVANVRAGLIDTGLTNNSTYGLRTLQSLTTGSRNTAMGNYSMIGATNINDNTAIGFSCLKDFLVGSRNTAIGSNCMLQATNCTNNTAVGYLALANCGGNHNTAIGFNAGGPWQSVIVSGNRNTFLGDSARSISPSINNATAIGSNALVSASNSMVLGDTSVNVGIGVTAPTEKLHIQGNIRMVDGNQAAGKIATSDANGVMSWQDAAGTGWELTGNAGTNPVTQLLGTTDARALRIRSGYGNDTLPSISAGIDLVGQDGGQNSAYSIYAKDSVNNHYSANSYDPTAHNNFMMVSNFAKDTGIILDLYQDKFQVLSLGNGELVTVLDNGNVGIGTTTPTFKLQVDSNFLSQVTAGNVFYAATNYYPNATLHAGQVVDASMFIALKGDTNIHIGIFRDTVTDHLFAGILWSDGAGTDYELLMDDNGLRYKDGTQGVGKVATSDADGNISWATPGGSSTLGIYLPDTFDVVGTDTIEMDSLIYTHSGNAISVWGEFTTRIVSGVPLSFEIALPVAATFLREGVLSGVASPQYGGASGTSGKTLRVHGSVSNGRAVIVTENNINLANPTKWSINFSYADL